MSEDIKAKIAKMMAMAMDGRGNAHEAEVAMRMASRLMTKHGIDIADLEALTGEKPQYKFISMLIPSSPTPTAKCVTWFGALSIEVANFTDCSVKWKRNPQFGMCVAFQGEENDVHYACWLQKYLRDQVRVESAAFVGSRREKEDFRRAMVSRVGERMKALKAAAKEELKAHITSSGGSALAIVDNKIALRNAEFGVAKYGKATRRTSSADGYHAGRAAGDRVNINRPVGHEKRALGNS